MNVSRRKNKYKRAGIANFLHKCFAEGNSMNDLKQQRRNPSENQSINQDRESECHHYA